MRSLAAPSLLAALLCVAPRALAAPVDPRTLRDQTEERVLDRDLDAEDLATARPGDVRALTAGPRTSAFVSVGLRVLDLDQRKETVGFLTVGLPFDRLFGPEPGVDRSRLAPPTTAALAEATVAPPAPAAAAELARSCVRAAFRAAGLADDERIDSATTRARASALLPETRLRVVHTTSESLLYTPTQYDPARYDASGGAGYLYEARLTFRLDRLVFADEEVQLERLRLERAEARSKLAARVLQALFEWERARVVAGDATLPAAEHLAAVLRVLEAEATLDVLTEGWFSASPQARAR